MSSKAKDNSNNTIPLIIGGLGLVIVAVVGILMGRANTTRETSPDVPLFPPVEVDQPAPALALTTLTGEEVSLADFRGQVILVNNWATWCPPCRREMPEFNSYYNKYHEKGFILLAVEAGSPEIEVRSFVEQHGLDFIILLDPEGKSLETFQNSSLPNSFVIDRKGHLRLAWLGAINEATLEEYVSPLIKE